ncbi:unnamed protein product [Staurois parvus]|uniref:Uncharacterized protein n=1 Tax=Staurois parvus TaxID=386267 RepID=A0ABN9EFK2_9NEOB|nr:unnamed protein product [Staurois parvus]
MFDPDLSAPPLVQMSTSYLLRQTEPVAILHMLSVVCIARDTCYQHRVNQHCPERGQGSCILLEQKENSSYKL